MALIQCTECAQRISSNAAACPACGNPTGRRAKVESKSSGAAPKALGFVLIVVGMGFAFSDSGTLGGALILMGLVAFIAGRFKD